MLFRSFAKSSIMTVEPATPTATSASDALSDGGHRPGVRSRTLCRTLRSEGWCAVTRRSWLITAALVVVAIAIPVIAVLLDHPSHTGRTLPPPRARVYASTTVCLLTGPTGLADPQAAAAWSGMQSASATTHVKVTYLAVTGPATAANVEPYVNTEVQQQCAMVVAVGSAQVTAVEARASSFPTVRFAVVSATTPPAGVSDRKSVV